MRPPAHDVITGFLVVAFLGAAPSLRAQNRAQDFPARDSHQGVTIAAVPLRAEPEAEKVFGKNAVPLRAGIMPVELIVTNERSEPIRIALRRIVVQTNADKCEQVEPERIAWVLYPQPKTKRPMESGRLPSRLPKDKERLKREEAEASLRRLQLRADVIPPGGSARGYLYFNFGRLEIDWGQARVYIPEVVLVPSEEALLFFEIELKPYTPPE